MDFNQNAKAVIETATKAHAYPSNYPKGSYWATDEAWEILDRIEPGIIPDDVRCYIAGAITGVLVKYAGKDKPT